MTAPSHAALGSLRKALRYADQLIEDRPADMTIRDLGDTTFQLLGKDAFWAELVGDDNMPSATTRAMTYEILKHRGEFL